jgi:hypothetical protein
MEGDIKMSALSSEDQIKIIKGGLPVHNQAVGMDADLLKETEEKLKSDPDNYYLWAARGVLYFTDNFEKSVESFSQAIRLNPLGGNQYHNRGRKYLSLGRYAEAAADFRISTELDQLDPWKWHFLGVAYYFLEYYEKAETAFRKAIDVNHEYGGGSLVIEVDWIFLSLFHIDKREEALRVLDLIDENALNELGDTPYAKRVRLYKGLIPYEKYFDEIDKTHDKRAITELYAAAFYNRYILNDAKNAISILDNLLEIKNDTYAFGYKQALTDREIWAAKK